MLEGFSPGNYLFVVEYTGRLFRDGKATISAELTGILERIGSPSESWWTKLEKQLNIARTADRFLPVVSTSLAKPTTSKPDSPACFCPRGGSGPAAPRN
jgi:hypothetical protein